MKEKIIIENFALYYLTIYVPFIIEMGELVRYYLLVVSIRGCNFNKTGSIFNKSGGTRNGSISTFWAENIALQN